MKENCIIFIIKHADKWVVTKKLGKYELFSRTNGKMLDNKEVAKQILSDTINAIKFDLYKLGNLEIKEKSQLKEYSIFYANIDLFEQDKFNKNKTFYLCNIDDRKSFKLLHFDAFKIYEEEIVSLSK